MAIIKPVSNNYQFWEDLEKVLIYIMNEEKTKPEWIGGQNTYAASVEDIVQQFAYVQVKMNKYTGRNFYHIVLSFSPIYEKAVTPFIISNYVDMLLFSYYREHQAVYAIHQNPDDDSFDAHIVINAVNFVTGEKYRESKEMYVDMRFFLSHLTFPMGEKRCIREIPFLLVF